jgi:uncharacterized protein YndB with AHSA1/START domain
MSTPDVPLRMELTVELPGTPEQVWDAIATANGITAWFTQTDLEERAGGAVTFHMGEDMASTGEVTVWEPNRHLAYAEPDWAPMAGMGEQDVTPMVTEFLIEASSGGTCSLRVVTSAFGTGAEWEREFFDDMAKHWAPFFDNLRLYLTHFPGQQVTPMEVDVDVPGPCASAWAVVVAELGADAVGETVTLNGVRGTVERVGDGINQLMVRVEDPVPGFLLFGAHDMPEGKVRVGITGYLFSDGAPAWVEAERPRWKAWLDGLVIPAA